MMRFSFGIITLMFFLYITDLAAQTRIPPQKPKLVIGISLENLSHDYLHLYWDKLQKGGVKKLIQQGTYCKNTRIDYLIAQPIPGMASIVTGCSPSVHGFVSDEWYDRNNDEYVSGLYNRKMKLVGEGVLSGKWSPNNLLTSSYTDELKIHKPNDGKVISVSPDYQSAIIGAAHTANAAYWFDASTGNWVSNTYYMSDLPSWVVEFNNKKLTDVYFTKTWQPLSNLETYSESLEDNSKYEKGFKKQGREFPYSMEKLKGKELPYENLFNTPFGNSFMKDFILQTIISEELGTDNNTDVLIINIPTFRNIENLFSQKSKEMEDAILRFDKELAHFLTFIDEQIGKEGVLIYLTSSSVSHGNVDYLKDNRVPADYFEVDKATVLLKAYLNAVYGAGDWVHAIHNQQIYLNREIIENSNLELSKVQRRVAAFMMELSGVQRAIAASDLQNNEFTSGILSIMQNSFYYKRSGDVFFHLQPGWIEKNGKEITGRINNSLTVPLVWYGWKVKRAVINRDVSVFDIAPTISDILMINKPSGCEGKIIPEIVE